MFVSRGGRTIYSGASSGWGVESMGSRQHGASALGRKRTFLGNRDDDMQGGLLKWVF